MRHRDLSLAFSTRRCVLGCVAVLLSAPLLPGTEPEKKEQAAVAPEAVVFCAYNLKNWLTMDRFDGTKTVLQSPKPEAEKEAVLAIISAIHPDILGVCEVGTEDDVHDLQKRLRSRGLDYPHVERAQGGDQTRSLALLSRFPIIARNSQTNLTYRIKDTAFPVQRGFLDATVKIADGFEMRCIGAHLKSKREIEEADQALMRRSEAHLLRKHLDSIIATDKDSKILLYGDFNEHRNEPAISTLIGSRASDSYMGEVKIWDVDGEVWTHFWDAADVYSRFDYFFASKALRPHIFYKKSFIYSKREFDQASDHRPIITTIRLKPPE